MKDILLTIVDYVFSLGMLLTILCVGFFFVIGALMIKTEEQRDLTQLRTETCYAQGMVLVQSDAGQRCVAPANLIKVK